MPMRPTPTAMFVAAITLLLVAPTDTRAQHEGHGTAMASDSSDGARPNAWHMMAQAIPAVTRAQNTAGGADLTEGYLSQAAAMGRGDLLSGHLRLEATLNAE